MANRSKTKQYKAGLRVREAETTRDNAIQGLHDADKQLLEMEQTVMQCAATEIELKDQITVLRNEVQNLKNSLETSEKNRVDVGDLLLTEIFDKQTIELTHQLIALETDRDEWKDACIIANRRFEDAEKKLRDISTGH